MRFVLAALSLSLALAAPSAVRAQEEMQFFSVGSGDIGGGYYAAAGALCEVMNRAAGPDLRCSPEPTAGSLYNLTMLHEGELDFAFAQSDWQRIAYEGGGPIAEGAPMRGLRSVMALYPEMVTVVARRGAGIDGPADLVGKRIDVGQPGSGRNASVRRLMAAIGFQREDFAAVSELSTSGAFEELCAGRIDVTVLIIGHPNEAVGRVLRDCDAEIVPFVGAAPMREAIEGTLGLDRGVIPRTAYEGLLADVPTYAVIATVVTRERAEPELVMRFVSAALESLPELGARAPVLRGMTLETMRGPGLVAPMHPGAATAFEAAGGE